MLQDNVALLYFFQELGLFSLHVTVLMIGKSVCYVHSLLSHPNDSSCGLRSRFCGDVSVRGSYVSGSRNCSFKI